MSSQKNLIELLEHEEVLKTPIIKEALFTVDRENFVPKDQQRFAYVNEPISIGWGQTISQPYTVVFMLELLAVETGQMILEAGYGSGWQTALLAHLVGPFGHVYAFEIVPELCQFGRQNVEKYLDLARRVNFHCQSAETLVSGIAFDAIICAAEIDQVPASWRQQLKTNGRLVYPKGHSIFLENKTASGWKTKEFPGFVFVPFIKKSSFGVL